MGSTGWITVIMVAAVLLPGLLLLFTRGMIRFNNHPTVVALNQRMQTSFERHRRAWALGLAAQAVIGGFLQWWLGQFPIILVFGLVNVWVFHQEQPDWMRDAFPEDLAGWSDQDPPGPKASLGVAERCDAD